MFPLGTGQERALLPLFAFYVNWVLLEQRLYCLHLWGSLCHRHWSHFLVNSLEHPFIQLSSLSPV